MRRIVQVLWLAAIVGFAGTAAAAGLDQARIAAMEKAADVFLTLGKDAHQTGQPPRQSDPAVRALLDPIFDTGGLAALAPIVFADLDKLNAWTMRVASVGSIYIFSGTGVPDFAHLHGVDEKLQQKVAENTVAYAPEVGRYFDSSVQVSQAMVAAVMAEVAAKPANFRNPQAERGLGQIRSGVKQTVSGVVTTFLTPGLDPAWMRARLAPLTAAAPVVAKFLAQDDRDELREVIKQVAAAVGDPALKQGLAALGEMFGA